MTNMIGCDTMTDITGETPVNGSAPTEAPEQEISAEFTADHWRKVPRQMTPPVRIIGINTRGELKEFVTDNGARFTRPTKDLKQLITVGTAVQVQIIRAANGSLVTGLFLPEVNGWAWQMDADELAAYAREVAEAIHNKRMKVKLAMVTHLKGAMLQVLNRQPRFQKLGDESQDQLAEELAVEAVIALETGRA